MALSLETKRLFFLKLEQDDWFMLETDWCKKIIVVKVDPYEISL